MPIERSKQRNYGLDNLKTVICLIVVISHTILPYMGTVQSWYFLPELPNETLSYSYILTFNDSVSMFLFFMVAGYFVPTSFDKQGFKTFMIKKGKRLLIPAMIVYAYCWAIIPEEICHIWFLEMLFLFCLAYALIRKFFPNCKLENDDKHPLTLPLLLLLAIGISAITIIVQTRYPFRYQISKLFIYFEPTKFPQYVMAFTLGIISRRYNWFRPGSLKIVCTMIAGIILVILMERFNGVNEYNYAGSRSHAIFDSIFALFLSILYIWFFVKFLNVTGKAISVVSENIMGIYLFHVPLLYYTQTYTSAMELYFPLKLSLIFLFVLCSSFTLSFLLRKIPVVREYL